MGEVQLSQVNTYGLNIQNIRDEFPMLQYRLNGKQLIYLDSASTAHKAKRVIERLQKFYLEEYAKPKESHTLSLKATEELEATRKKMAAFIGAKSEKEVVFSRGSTEGINILAGGFGRGLLKEGDEVLITALEHHANIVPWLMACELSGAKVKAIPINQKGDVDLDAYEKLLSDRTKIVAVSHTSHALGNKLPVKEMVSIAHKKGVPIMLDGSQAVPHMTVNMQELDCDFYVFSGHKMGAPSGVGVLYGKEEWLQKLPPFEGGADMTKDVTLESYTPSEAPYKFEAGTTPFVEIISFGTLLDYVNELGMDKIEKYEQELLSYATERMSEIDRVKIMGTDGEKEPVLAVSIDGVDVKKVEKFLNDEYNIEAKAGTLTAQPLMKILGKEGLLRVAFGYYNTTDEIDTYIGAVEEFIRKNG